MVLRSRVSYLPHQELACSTYKTKIQDQQLRTVHGVLPYRDTMMRETNGYGFRQCVGAFGSLLGGRWMIGHRVLSFS